MQHTCTCTCTCNMHMCAGHRRKPALAYKRMRCVCVCICTRTCTCNIHAHAHAHVHMCVCMCNMCAHATCTCACMRVQLCCVCVCACVPHSPAQAVGVQLVRMLERGGRGRAPRDAPQAAALPPPHPRVRRAEGVGGAPWSQEMRVAAQRQVSRDRDSLQLHPLRHARRARPLWRRRARRACPTRLWGP
jgi:hypothetical protein